MSCVQPITIINNSRHFNESYDKRYLVVPCGKCYACQVTQQNEWWIRSYFQCQSTSVDGYSLMLTFTYNNSCLPYFPSSDIPAFSKSDIHYFLDKLRHYLLREHGYTGFKYLIASEYGEVTKRPHYHAIMHFPHC